MRQGNQSMGRSIPRPARAMAALGLAMALSGCLSLKAEVPDQLLTLRAETAINAGTGASGTAREAIAVMEPDAPQALDVTRLPVRVSDSRIAYLKDALWVEKPARLFGRLLAETIRASGGRLVLDGGASDSLVPTRLSGQLLDMGYDAPTGGVVMRYEAVLTRADGTISTRRFESVEPGIPAEAGAVGAALNRAANDVARQVAEWVR